MKAAAKRFLRARPRVLRGGEQSTDQSWLEHGQEVLNRNRVRPQATSECRDVGVLGSREGFDCMNPIGSPIPIEISGRNWDADPNVPSPIPN